MRSSLLKSAVAVSLAAGVISGCGSSSSSSSSPGASGAADNGVAAKPPEAIVAAASSATTGARAVHIAGSVVSGGTPITLDMHLASGSGGRGQLSENGLSFQLINIGKTVYINASPAFWKHFGGTAAAQLLQGKWLKAPATDPSFGSLTSLTDFHQFFRGALSSHGKLTKGATTTLNGHKVVALNDTSQGGTLYVATTGPAYPVEIAKAGAGGGKVVFDSWNEPVSLTPPANSIDVSQLKTH